jgi:hypothetical protein
MEAMSDHLARAATRSPGVDPPSSSARSSLNSQATRAEAAEPSQAAETTGASRRAARRYASRGRASSTVVFELTRNRLAAADRRQGRRGLWLRTLDRLGLGFDS